MFVRSLIVSLSLLVLSACSTLTEFATPPKVSITNIELLPGNFLSPRFAISLQVKNPNPVPLPIKGLAYDINLNGLEVFNGVTNEVPLIPAYGEIPLKIELGANLIQATQFVLSLRSGNVKTLDYSINTDVSVSGISKPFAVSESGKVDLISQ